MACQAGGVLESLIPHPIVPVTVTVTVRWSGKRAVIGFRANGGEKEDEMKPDQVMVLVLVMVMDGSFQVPITVKSISNDNGRFHLAPLLINRTPSAAIEPVAYPLSVIPAS